jgi:hypothetical protein
VRGCVRACVCGGSKFLPSLPAKWF